MNRQTCGELAALMLMVAGNSAAAPIPLELRWNELAPLISGRVVRLTAPGGATIQGGIAAIREDVLVMDVSKTSDSKAFPKGNANIPRASVSMLEVQRLRFGPRLGMSLGSAAALPAGLAVARHNSLSPGAAAGVLGAFSGAGMVGGYFIGSALDRGITQIRVIP